MASEDNLLPGGFVGLLERLARPDFAGNLGYADRRIALGGGLGVPEVCKTGGGLGTFLPSKIGSPSVLLEFSLLRFEGGELPEVERRDHPLRDEGSITPEGFPDGPDVFLNRPYPPLPHHQDSALGRLPHYYRVEKTRRDDRAREFGEERRVEVLALARGRDND